MLCVRARVTVRACAWQPGAPDASVAAAGSPRAGSPRKRVSAESADLFPTDLTADAIAALSRHTHHGHDAVYGGATAPGSGKKAGRKVAAMWAGQLKLGVTTPANIGRFVRASSQGALAAATAHARWGCS
jgi:hypothetical protein